ncbi:iron-sulfur cluster assembly scaffold protein [Patescibacteria group bacterium]|nr:iron-sulfur cluster assembly scaffold protein [Patescibacteria group bacterium]
MFKTGRPELLFHFTLNIKEDEIVNDIKKISKKLFNLDIAVRRLPERKTVVIDLYSAKLARFFKEILKNGAANKIIPDFIMHLSPERQKPLIYGLWKGDGCLNLKRAGARGGYVTVSYKLAQQIKILLLRQKIVPSIYVDKEKKIKNVNHKEAYRIHIGQRDSLIKLCSILGVEYIPRSYASVDSWFDKNFCYTPITQIKELNYRGLVYNLEVSSTHSFTSDAFCLHNCGDLMNIYIKVAKNKKGQEIIKDIKFETLGCVAAIATSSMVTAMAKGKTLDEALKIKYSDIAEALGSLPPIKTHCADLAVKGLRAAIEDYKNNLKLKNQNEK